MKIQPVKGTRDLYPEEFAPILRIFDAWRTASLRHGFQEFEGPTLEMLDLYREKSGEELVGQLFRLTDAGGRELALRPEMTPTLARMVAARLHTLPKPIKWFCIPKLFRGENVQRGRLREFFQWNVDIVGAADVVADAECILVGVEALRTLGLTHEDFVVAISNRRLIAALLAAAGVPEAAHQAAYALMDKADRMPAEELASRWEAHCGTHIRYSDLNDLLSAEDLDSLRATVGEIAGATEALETALSETERLLSILQDFGIIEYCELNLKIVRGLAYYTGPVFEFHDRSRQHRAICGGGRYDDLLGKLGKHPEPAVGFGMGDVVLTLLLEEKGLARAADDQAGGVFVADATDGLRPTLHRVVAALRAAGFRTEFAYARQALVKQLKAAVRRGCGFAVILGTETAQRSVVQVKDFAAGEARETTLDNLLARPEGFFKRPS